MFPPPIVRGGRPCAKTVPLASLTANGIPVIGNEMYQHPSSRESVPQIGKEGDV